MVKRNKRPRMKRTKATLKTLKKKQHTGFMKINTQFGNKRIEALWDKESTLRQNYVRLGLEADPNSYQQREKEHERLSKVDIDEDVNVLINRMKRKSIPKDEEDGKELMVTKRRKRAAAATTQEEDVEDQRKQEEEDEGEEEENAESDGEIESPHLSPEIVQLHEQLGRDARAVVIPYQVKVIDTQAFASTAALALLNLCLSRYVEVLYMCGCVFAMLRQSMAVKEQKRLRLLIGKYGENVSAMARDIELNSRQETEGELRRRIALFRRLAQAE